MKTAITLKRRGQRDDNEAARRMVWYSTCGRYRVVRSEINGYPVRYRLEWKYDSNGREMWTVQSTHRTKAAAIRALQRFARILRKAK